MPPYLLIGTHSEDEFLATPDLAVVELTGQVLGELKKKIEIFKNICAEDDAVIIGYADYEVIFYRDLYDQNENDQWAILEERLMNAEKNCLIVDKLPGWLGEATGDWVDSPRLEVDDNGLSWLAFYSGSGRSFSTKSLAHEIFDKFEIQKI